MSPQADPSGGRDAFLIVIVALLVVAIVAVSFLSTGSGDDETASPGDRIATTTVTLEPTPSDSSGWTPVEPEPFETTTTVGARPGTFGFLHGRAAPLEDLDGFCNANIEFTFALSDVLSEVETRSPMREPTFQDALSAWFSGQSEYPAGPVAAMVAAFGTAPPSDEAVTLQELGAAIEARPEGQEAGEVGDLVLAWSDRFLTALDAVHNAYTATC